MTPGTTTQITPATTGSPSNTMSFLAASESGQTILAKTSSETLVGSPQHSDTFQGMLANLNGDLIKLFGGNDAIDVTGLDFTRAAFSYSGTETSGTLNLTDGVHNAHIGLSGDFNQSAFHLASDLHGGTNITYG